jgi:hypothetical protein
LLLRDRELPNCQRSFTTLEGQIVSKFLAIKDCQITSSGLAIRECQIASNQDDACPRYLAMLVMLC